MKGFGTTHGACTQGRLRMVGREVWGAAGGCWGWGAWRRGGGHGQRCCTPVPGRAAGMSIAKSQARAMAVGVPRSLPEPPRGRRSPASWRPAALALAAHHRAVPRLPQPRPTQAVCVLRQPFQNANHRKAAETQAFLLLGFPSVPRA